MRSVFRKTAFPSHALTTSRIHGTCAATSSASASPSARRTGYESPRTHRSPAATTLVYSRTKITFTALAVGPMAGQSLIIGDNVSVAERLLHRARAGEFVLSKTIMDALAAAGFVLEAEELPPLEMPRREPIRLFGVLCDTRLDFT